MVFSSLLFLFRFLPIVLLAYYILPKKCRNFVLFLSSLVFYAWGEPVYVVLILLSTCVDYAAGLAVHYFKEKGKMSGAKVMVACSVLPFRKTSIIHMNQKALRNSGAAGIFRWGRGSGNMCIFRWAETAMVSDVRY